MRINVPGRRVGGIFCGFFPALPPGTLGWNASGRRKGEGGGLSFVQTSDRWTQVNLEQHENQRPHTRALWTISAVVSDPLLTFCFSGKYSLGHDTLTRSYLFMRSWKAGSPFFVELGAALRDWTLESGCLRSFTYCFGSFIGNAEHWTK